MQASTELPPSRDILSSLATLLASSRTSSDYVRAVATHSLFGQYTIGSELLFVTKDATLATLAQFGTPALPRGEIVSLWDDGPVSTAARTGIVSKGTVVDPDTGEENFLFCYPFTTPSHTVGIHVMIKSQDHDIPLEDQDQRTISMFAGLWLQTLGVTDQITRPSSANNESNELTDRQLTILKLMSGGLTNARIAGELILSESTIRQETVRIFRKLGVPGRSEAKKIAEQLGLLERVAS